MKSNFTDVEYEVRPYYSIALGALDIWHPMPWWGILSGTTLVTLGVLIYYMRYTNRRG